MVVDKVKMSQSLMKSLFAYKEKKECGLVIKAKYIDGMEFPSSDAMELGNWFEYICTNAPARDGHIPEPKMLKSGKMAIDYLRMEKQKENFNKIMDSYGFKIESTSYNFKNEDFSGIADIIAKDKIGNRVIIDLKSSGLINDKWSDYGWDESSMEYKHQLLVQAVHYKMLAFEEFEEELDFFFFVFSTKNEESKIYKIIVDDATMQTHINNINEAQKFFEKEVENGFNAIPEMKRCSNCPLKADCEHFVDVPLISTIYY